MRHLKERKIMLYATEHQQDSAGSWRTAYVSKGSFWANVKPVSMTANYTNVGIFDIAEFIVTINKPRFQVTTGFYTIFDDRVLKATRVEDVEGKTSGDLRIYFKTVNEVSVESFTAKLQ